MEIEEALELVFQQEVQKIVISKPRSKELAYKKIRAEKKGGFYQVELFTDRQVFHERAVPETLRGFCLAHVKKGYGQLNIWDEEREHSMMISTKGKVHYQVKKRENVGGSTAQEHNRKKKYLLEEGTEVPVLTDMGIFTQEGKVVRSMYDKYKQINRFLELINDAVSLFDKETLHVVDFGCGKSYLTFVLYHYFTQIKHRSVNMVGLDLKEDVIEKCNMAARKYGYENLRFERGDIKGYHSTIPIDMVVTLHACDTATDHALYHAVKWGAKMIFSVPCCQHELNQQMKSGDLSLLTRYGIIQERSAALMTDAIRADLLEACGYRTQVLEFVDLEHTPKNLMLRAVKQGAVPQKVRRERLEEVRRAMEAFSFRPTLYELMEKEGWIKAGEAAAFGGK